MAETDVVVPVVEEATPAVEPMEGVEVEKKDGEEPKKEEKEHREEDEYEDDEDETDPVKAEDLRVNPRLYLIVGPILMRDLFTLRDIRNIMTRCEHFEVKYFTKANIPADQVRKPKRGYIRFNFKTAQLSYWVLDNLRNLQLIRVKNKTKLNCYMTNQIEAHDTMHMVSDGVVAFKRKIKELEEQDISLRALYFGNFPKTIDEEKLKEFIPEATEVTLPTYKEKPRGYAYVEFPTKEVAAECLASYKGKKLGNMPIVVRKIGTGKGAQLLRTGEANRRRNLRMGLRGNEARRFVPGRGRRFPAPEWDVWARDRRFGGGRDYYPEPPYPFMGRKDDSRRGRRGRMEGWAPNMRREFRQQPYGMRPPVRTGGNDMGYGDPWMSSSSLTQNY